MMMSCVVPPGFGPGMMIQVNTPAGLMNVPIPNGATPGYKFDFLVPAPPPRVAPRQSDAAPCTPVPLR